jgi:two-component system cell cycle sensor histidine kinase/response regulator CckA
MKKAAKTENHPKTVLIVDDNADLLAMVSEILADANYKVLTASSGQAALKQSKNTENDIHLLLSDFQMPAMNGVDLATKMTADRPALKVLLMSGFTDGMLVLNEGWHFLPKPFIASQLCTLVTSLVYPEKRTRFAKNITVG